MHFFELLKNGFQDFPRKSLNLPKSNVSEYFWENKLRQRIVFSSQWGFTLLLNFRGGSWDNGRSRGSCGGGEHSQPHLRREKLPGEASLSTLVSQKRGMGRQLLASSTQINWERPKIRLHLRSYINYVSMFH